MALPKRIIKETERLMAEPYVADPLKAPDGDSGHVAMKAQAEAD
jgi:hypothetical protein